ncbi:hypothetical protein Tco_0181846, partial [Tanacetum coccineum]
QVGEGAGVAAQAIPPPIPEPIPEPMSEPDQPQDNVEDEPLGGSFHASPSRSTQASPAGHTSGGAEDLITLTALSFVVSTFVQKVNSLETKAHKKLFKDVVGKLVKKVKAMEVEMSASQRETRQTEVLSSIKHYSDADWIDIIAQVHANAGLSSELLGVDVNDDNFAERMVA